MSVSNGQLANEANFNAAFISKLVDSTTVGVITLNNTSDVNSGNQLTNLQRAVNELFDACGITGEGDATANTYSSNDVITNGDTYKVALGKLDAAFTTKIDKPVSATDNTIARWDLTENALQDSGVTIDDSDNVTIPGDLTVNGTTTTINTTNLDVTDKNITVNDGGNDASSEGAGLTVERTGTDGSLVYEDALTSKFKLGALGSEVEVATVSGAQVITNKDIDGGTASNTNRIALPKDTTTNLDALTDKEGLIAYDTTLSTPVFNDGTVWAELGSGGGSGAAMSDFESFTPTMSWVAGVTNLEAFKRRVGDSMEILLSHDLSSGPVAVDWALTIPDSLTADTAKIPNSTSMILQNVGHAFLYDASASASRTSGVVYLNATDATKLNILSDGSGTVNSTTPFTWVSTDRVFFRAIVPILGWSSNVTIGTGSTFRISTVLDGGTRVTAAPAALGEYRSRYKSGASSNTITDVAPTTLPSISNGMRLHAIDYTAAQTSGLISVYDIYIGENKNYRVEYYSGTLNTGGVSTDVQEINTASARGSREYYDPTTGVLTIDVGRNAQSSNTSRNIGLDSSFANVSDGYFDVIVSENVQAIGFDGLNKWQQKNLTADSTNVNGTLSDLTFNSLVIGKVYRVTLHAWMSTTATDGFLGIDVMHNGVKLTFVKQGVNGVAADAMHGVSRVFVATAATVTFDVFSASPNATIFGDASATETYAEIEELNNYELTESTDFS